MTCELGSMRGESSRAVGLIPAGMVMQVGDSWRTAGGASSPVPIPINPVLRRTMFNLAQPRLNPNLAALLSAILWPVLPPAPPPPSPSPLADEERFSLSAPSFLPAKRETLVSILRLPYMFFAFVHMFEQRERSLVVRRGPVRRPDGSSIASAPSGTDEAQTGITPGVW